VVVNGLLNPSGSVGHNRESAETCGVAETDKGKIQDCPQKSVRFQTIQRKSVANNRRSNSSVKFGIAVAIFHPGKGCGSGWLVRLKIRFPRWWKQSQRLQHGYGIEPASVKSIKLDGHD